MKFIALLTVLIASPLFAQQNPQSCFTIKNNIDRRYCVDKYLESVKDKLTAEKKSWAKGLTGDVKAAKAEAISAEVAARKDQLSLISSEIALHEQQLADLNSVKVTAPAAPKKKKKEKEKPKLPFGIKL